MNLKKVILFFIASALVCFACTPKTENKQHFVSVKNVHFVIGDQPYYYIGTNFWYGAILGSEGQGGDRERLHK